MARNRKPEASEGDEPLPPHLQKAVDAAHKPECWDTLAKETLETVAFVRFTAFGLWGDVKDQPEIDRLYSVMLKRLSVESRRWLEGSVRDYVMEGETGASALLPFLQGDTDRTVISIAALDYAMLMPRVNGDPLSGPKFLVSRFDEAKGNDAVRLGILTGLILLGDERLLPLVKGRWKEFQSAEDRRRLAASKSGFVCTLLIEFLLDWLENTTDESDIGAIAGAMTRMPMDAQIGFVIRQRRCFPASDAEPGKQIEILERWSFADYAKVIRPRLEPLIANETPPQVIPAILEYWEQAE